MKILTIFIILLFSVLSANCQQAPPDFRKGSYKKGELVKALSGLIYRARKDVNNAQAQPKSGAIWEQVKNTTTPNVDSVYTIRTKRRPVIDTLKRIIYYK